MREPGFWWKKPGWASRLLWPISVVYGAVTAWRMNRTGRSVGIPVICVGNFTLGGTGKTPTAIAIAKMLAADGETPVFLSRGYGGRERGPLQVDASRHRAGDVGDEPLLLARHAPAIVSRDRVAGAKLAVSLGASIIVMDDGLQNPSLTKNLSIAVIDTRRGFGNGCVFPAGPLRAPIESQIGHVQALLGIGSGSGRDLAALERDDLLPVFKARLEPDGEAVASIGTRGVYAFAGIGDPDKFFDTLTSAGIEAAVEEPFPDHHVYSEEDASRILSHCEQDQLVPVTTEKDLVRLLGQSGPRGRLAQAALPLPVSLKLDDAKAFAALLRRAVTAPKKI